MKKFFKRTRIWLIPLVTAFILLALVLNVETLAVVLKTLFSAVVPIIAGFSLAFVLNVPLRFFEEKCLSGLKRSKRRWVRRVRRPLALIITLVLFLGLLALIPCVIIPELIRTAEVIISNLPGYADTVISYIQKMLISFNMPEETVNTLTVDWSLFITKLLDYVQTPSVANAATDITAGLINGIFGTVMSIVIAIYTLMQKKQIIRFFKRFINAVLPARFASPIFEFARLSDSAFSGFIRGQFLNAVILGIFTYVGMLIFGFPYPEAISVFLAVTSLIPIIGPILGAALGAFLILMTSYVQALFFLLFVVILQQIEGNVIYPRIVGKTLGMPGIIILSAVVIGSRLFGIVGIIIGVPLSSVIYTLTKRFIDKRLSAK